MAELTTFSGKGVPYIWVVNPRKLRAFQYTCNGTREAKDGILRTAKPDIVMPLLELESSNSHQERKKGQAANRLALFFLSCSGL